jgi:hypothetical protein
MKTGLSAAGETTSVIIDPMIANADGGKDIQAIRVYYLAISKFQNLLDIFFHSC